MERAQLLKAARLKQRLTREQAAERLGVDPSTVKRWENGTSIPQPINLHSIAEVYGITPQTLGLSAFPSIEETSVATQNATIPKKEEGDDVLTSFRQRDLTSRLTHIVWNWLLTCHHARYQELQTLIALELEDYSRMHPDNINRRNALRRMALLAIDLCALSALQPVLKRPIEEILTYCASGITACWYLRKGKELAFADEAVSKYIPTLEAIAKTALPGQRKAAADLLTQCFLLRAPLAWNLTTPKDAINYAQQAVVYSTVTDSCLLQVTALRTTAASFCYANQWEQATQAAEKAKCLLEERDRQSKQKHLSVTSHSAEEPIPQLVYSYVYAGLATYQAYNGQEDDALDALKKAHQTFFERPKDEKVPIWIDHNVGNLLINDGETHIYLGSYKEAISSLEQISAQYAQDTTISATGRINALIHQVTAEVSRDDKLRDMQWCMDCWKRGIEEAKAVQSQQHFNEAIQAYAAMRAAWPGEKRIKELRDLIVHW